MKTEPVSSQNSCFQSSNFCKGMRITLIALGALLLLFSVLGFLKVGAFSNMGTLGSSLAASGSFVCLVLAYFCKPSKNTYDDFFTAIKGSSQAEYVINAIKHHPEWALLKDENGNTPLHFAAGSPVTGNDYGCITAILPLILKGKADGNAVNNLGQTPLHCAVLNGNNIAVKELLVPMRVNPSIQDNEGLTPLDYACLAFKNTNNVRNVQVSSGWVDSRIQILHFFILGCEFSQEQFPWHHIPDNRREEIRQLLYPT